MRQWKTKNGYTLTQLLDGRCNVFLLSNGTATILIDTGRKRHRKKLLSRLKKAKATSIDAIVLTHHHFDHTENAAFIKARYGATVIIHQAEASLLASGENCLPRATFQPVKFLISFLGKKLNPFFRIEPCIPDILVEDRYNLHEYHFQAYILHTPGHSHGSLSIIVDQEIALVGDAMFGIFPHTIFPPFCDDVPAMIASWKKLILTGCELFLPSHGTANKRALVEKCIKKHRHSPTHSIE